MGEVGPLKLLRFLENVGTSGLEMDFKYVEVDVNFTERSKKLLIL